MDYSYNRIWIGIVTGLTNGRWEFNVAKCKTMHIGSGNIKHDYIMKVMQWLPERTLGPVFPPPIKLIWIYDYVISD